MRSFEHGGRVTMAHGVNGTTGLGAIRNLDYTALLCDDLAVMRRFYTEVLGFVEAHHEISEHWIEFRLGASVLALRPRGRVGDAEQRSPSGPNVQLAFRVPPGDVEVAAAQLIAHGVEIRQQVTDQSFGHRTLFFADPEQNIIEIYAEI